MLIALGIAILVVCSLPTPRLCTVADNHLQQDHVGRFLAYTVLALLLVTAAVIIAATLLANGIYSLQPSS
jgi:hypothetical protein